MVKDEIYLRFVSLFYPKAACIPNTIAKCQEFLCHNFVTKSTILSTIFVIKTTILDTVFVVKATIDIFHYI